MGWIVFGVIYFIGAGFAALLTRLENLALPAPFDPKPVWLFALFWWLLLIAWVCTQIEGARFRRRLHRHRSI